MAKMALDAGDDDLPTGRCEECGNDAMYLDRVLLVHFLLHVCVTCRQDHTLRDGSFELLSKSRARAEYALPDSSFCGLPYLNKPNPRHKAYAPLQLYLRRALVQEAYRLYGNEEGLQREKQKRKKRAYRAAASRTKHLLKKQHVMHLDRDKIGVAQPTNVLDVKSVVKLDHRHTFGKERFDREGNIWTKRCDCGMQVEFEKL